MATFKICVHKHQKRATDGKYPVSIRVTWNRQSAYIKTSLYVTDKQITKDYQIKDASVTHELSGRINAYEDIKLRQIGVSIHKYTAKELADFFVKEYDKKVTAEIDFISFAEGVADKTSNKGTSGIYQTTINSLVRFLNSDVLFVNDIKTPLLREYEAWLVSQKLTPSGINLYMRTLRALFNKAREQYNDEDKGEITITHYPFKKYKILPPPETEKRAITIEQIKAIRDITLKQSRNIMARDVFMLSFYMVGINTVDLFNADKIESGRLSYYRTKTRSRRQDKAYISILILPEAKKLVKTYSDATGLRAFSFYKRYCDHQNFNKYVNLGLKNVAKAINAEIDKGNLPEGLKFDNGLEFYAARHSWATIARNQCGVSKDDVHEALNHASDKEMRVTDIYIRKDWGVIDQANRKVMDLL